MDERRTRRTYDDMDNGATLRMLGNTFRKRQFEILEGTMKKSGPGEHENRGNFKKCMTYKSKETV